MNYLLNRPGWGKGIVKALETSERISVMDNDQTLPPADYVFRWGCTSNIPGDPVVVNTAQGIHNVFDKKRFRMELSSEGLAPQSWPSVNSFGEQVEPSYNLSPPILVRKSPHFRSQNMDLCRNLLELSLVCSKYEKDKQDYYLSVFHDKHREFRVFCVQGRIVAMIEKHPQHLSNLSWGCVETGTFEYIAWTAWPLGVCDVAVRSMAMAKLDFGAVDVIVDTEGTALVVEINSAPDVTPYYGKCFVKAFEFILDNGKKNIAVTDKNKTWKSYIHPAIGGNA